MPLLTYNVELLSESQENFAKIERILEANRYAWNEISKVVYDNGLNLDRKTIHDKTYYPIRNAKPEIPSQIIIRAECDVRSAYKSVCSN